MACLHPLKRWVVGYDAKNDKDIAKITPWATEYVKYGRKTITEFQQIPCSKCIECRLNYAKEWATRCILEAKQYKHNEMLTLTYNDENIPKKMGIITKTGEYGEIETLVKKDVQDFLKRLRKASKQEFRYFMCGEYGTENKRPHYHIILFNYEAKDKKHHAYNKKGNEMFTSELINKAWGKGFAILNNVDYGSCEYVARYIIKKQKGPNAAQEYIDRGQQPEYTCMSRRPGIGNYYFEKLKEGDYETKKIWTKTQKALKCAKPCRYFDKLYEQFSPQEWEEIQKRRKEKQLQRQATLLAQTSLNEEEYRNTRELNLKARIKNNRLYESGAV